MLKGGATPGTATPAKTRNLAAAIAQPLIHGVICYTNYRDTTNELTFACNCKVFNTVE
jgi:hypothetical protein